MEYFVLVLLVLGMIAALGALRLRRKKQMPAEMPAPLKIDAGHLRTWLAELMKLPPAKFAQSRSAEALLQDAFHTVLERRLGTQVGSSLWGRLYLIGLEVGYGLIVKEDGTAEFQQLAVQDFLRKEPARWVSGLPLPDSL